MCGVAGVFGQDEAARWTCEALFAQQHRGQDSCGIASADGEAIRHFRGLGLVREALTHEVLRGLPGRCAIGHVRYPTQGAALVENAQPHVFAKDGVPRFALASNGDITNIHALSAEILRRGYVLEGTNDGEVIAKTIGIWAFEDGMGIEAAIRRWVDVGLGAFSAVLMTPTHLYAFRDPHGLRPLSWGEEGGTVVVASETVGLDILRVPVAEEVPPGSILRWGCDGRARLQCAPAAPVRHCIFEHIYFARPDSHLFGEKVFEVRRAIGEGLARGDEVSGDVVVPIPDSANYIGLAYANARNLPVAFGLVRNHYVGRTFIAPEQRVRDETVRLKFNPLPGFFAGKRVFVVDDSIVRGTTIRKLIRMMRENGAKEVHLRIGSPPIRHSCYYGIDTPERKKLIAADRSVEEVAALLEADTLRYLPMEGLRAAVSSPGDYCYACFTGDYPAGCKQGAKEL
jgi:amidophosphoribosyltransferase